MSFLQKEPPPGAEFASLRGQAKQLQGYAEFTLSNYGQAEERLKEAKVLAQTANDTGLLTSVEFLQARLLSRSGKAAEAEALINHADRLAVANHDRARESYGLTTLAHLLITQSRYEEAALSLERALSRMADAGDRPPQAAALNSLGMCLFRLGELDRALLTFQKARDLATQTGDTHNLQVALGNTGNIYLERNDYRTAGSYFEQALALSEKLNSPLTTAIWLSNLATVSIETKEWDRASAYNLRALSMKQRLHEPDGELHSLVNSARILEGQKKEAEAEGIFLKVMNSPSKDAAPSLYAHSGLAKMYANQGRDAQAAKEFEAALHVVEQTRSTLHADETKMNFLSNLMNVYGDYVDFLMARGKTERAQEVAEASRSRSLQERLGGSDVIRPVSSAEYRQVARSTGATLISYWLGEKRSYVWLTTPGQVIAYPLPPREKLRPLIETYRAMIENLHDPLDVEDPTGRELYDALLGPVAERIPAGCRLYIVPDGALHALNFETLPVASPKLHYFLEDATISVVPSLNMLVKRNSAVNRSGKLLLIGDPSFTSDRYPKLPFAENEIDRIESHFERSKVAAYRKAEAVPAVYRKAAGDEYAYVHFTAHATANHDVPLDSAIILSGLSGQNELTARDVLKNPMRANLVTISACRGAGAKTLAGEGLVGFMWAFFEAGARNVVAGLWDVSDESTPRLMDRLYAGLTSNESPAEALHAAKLELMKANHTYRLPYYWGAFQLYIR